MTGSHAAALAFALRERTPADARQVLYTDPAPGPGGRRLMIVVEPREPNPHAFGIANIALTTLQRSMLEASALPVPNALAFAFNAAHRAVWDENRPMAEGLQGRRCLVGVTMAVLEGRRLTVAQVPPSQAFVIQNGRVHAFPRLDSWRPDYVPTSDRPEPAPLGCEERIDPLIARTTAASGDIVVLCSSGVGHDLALDSAWGRLADDWAAGDAAALLAAFESVVVGHDRETAYVAAIPVGSLPEPQAHPGVEMLSRLSDRVVSWRPRVAATLPGAVATAHATPVLAVAGAATLRGGRTRFEGIGIPLDRDLEHPLATALTAEHEPAPVPQPVPLEDVRLVTIAGADVPVPEADQLEPVLTQPHQPHDLRRLEELARLGGDGNLPVTLTDGLAVSDHMRRAQWLDRVQTACVSLFERVVPQHESPELPYDEQDRADGFPPGALSIHRYREGHPLVLPDSWRAALPRGPVVKLPVRALAIAVVALVVLGSAGMAFSHFQTRSELANQHLAAADSHLQAAAKAPNGAAADAQLTLAQHELKEAQDKGASESALASRQQQLNQARDQARGVVRLTNVRRLGGLPANLIGKPARLARSGDSIYLVGGDLYQLDAKDHQLVDLLQQGSQIGSSSVGPLQDAAWNAASITATDGGRAYTLGTNGRWTPQPLGLFDGKTPWNAAAIGIFQGNIYFLDTGTGQILKFAADGLDKLPDDWAAQDLRPQIKTARDMVVDGKIYVLLKNGQILTLYRGALESTLKLNIIPTLVDPVAMYGAVDTSFLYIADPGSATTPGRIIRISRDGSQMQQLMMPNGDNVDPTVAQALSGIRDLTVDERTGTIYFITKDAVWQASLPGGGTG